MHTITLEEAQDHLAEILDKLTPSEEVVITRGNRPVARLSDTSREEPRTLPGRGRGMLRVVSEDDDHLKDFAEYLPGTCS